MHGHGYGPQHPPAPSGGPTVALRVMFVVLAVVTCGFLAAAPILRLALVTRKTRDWAAFGAVVTLDVAAIAFVANDPGEEITTWRGELGVGLLLGTLVAAVTYYLILEIRHFRQADAQARLLYHQAQAMGYATGPQQAYGYRQQTGPVPHPGPGPLPSPPAHTPTPPPPARPAPARIHQVRAELDELSDYLRKQEGGN
ncbi:MULTISPECIES: hypothetical protein [Streptomyces]|uniref:Integral membrane protein n=1 Tax=Streptomyces alboflavus TaxID=67267 RepID=A0A1Z1WCC5_9ACTN|nr:hypothetical protein [Streptomyces alboflavus]ARX84020.1 hypothetical protein SMD44_03454 [Streptomyces alboflavus]